MQESDTQDLLLTEAEECTRVTLQSSRLEMGHSLARVWLPHACSHQPSPAHAGLSVHVSPAQSVITPYSSESACQPHLAGLLGLCTAKRECWATSIRAACSCS